MKKALSLILAIVMAVFGLAPFSACAEEAKLPFMMQNPFISGEHYSTGTIDSEATEPAASRTYKGNTYYGWGKEFYSAIRKGLLNHKASIKVRHLSDISLTSGGIILSTITLRSFLFDILYYSTEDEVSVSCVDGDYLRYSILEYGFGNIELDRYKNGKYFYTITLAVKYNASEQQQKQVDSVVNSFVNSIDTNKLSDYDIIKKIHDFICKKTTYAYEAMDSPYANGYAFSAYGALVKGKCVCQGYASAFYRLCRELGYSSRVVISDPNRGNHAWNIVELDGKYYFVDCTWDDQVLDEGIDDFTEDYYFLINYPASLAYDNGSEHVPDPEYFDTTYYNNKYKKYYALSNYDASDLSLMSRSVVSLSAKSFTFDGTAKKPSVKVISGSGEVLRNGADYTVSYSGNVNTGSPFVYVTGTSDTADATHRRFYIKPSAASKPSASSTDSGVTLKWKANGGGVTGYSVEVYSGGRWSVAKNTTALSATVDSLSPVTKYKFRIRAYKDISKRRYYGAYSGERTVMTKPKRVSGVILGASKKKLTVSYKKVKGSGYIIQYSTKKNMKGAKEIKLSGAKKTSRTIKKLKSGQRYYVRVRAFKKYKLSGKTKYAYGKWSAKKSIKVK